MSTLNEFLQCYVYDPLCKLASMFNFLGYEDYDTDEFGNINKCSICWDISYIWNPIKTIPELDCGHRYHSSCIYDWLRNNSACPMCREHAKDIPMSRFKAFTYNAQVAHDNYLVEHNCKTQLDEFKCVCNDLKWIIPHCLSIHMLYILFLQDKNDSLDDTLDYLVMHITYYANILLLYVYYYRYKLTYVQDLYILSFICTGYGMYAGYYLYPSIKYIVLLFT